jgi:hypothetical protein
MRKILYVLLAVCSAIAAFCAYGVRKEVELTAHIPYAEAYAEILNLENPIGNHIW